MSNGPWHWCNEHPEHAIGSGARADRQLRVAVGTASVEFVNKLATLVGAGVLTKWEAKQALIEATRS